MALRYPHHLTDPPLREGAITRVRARRQSFGNRKKPIRPNLHQKLVALLIAGTLAVLLSLAYASPADPTWIAGIYDNADYDDVVAFLTDRTDTSGGQVATLAEQSAMAWTSLPKSDGVPRGTMSAEKSRGPPVKSCDGSIHLRLNLPVCRLTHVRNGPTPDDAACRLVLVLLGALGWTPASHLQRRCRCGGVGGRHVLLMCQGLGGQSLALVVSVESPPR